MPISKLAIGVDVGGTSVRVGLVNDRGQLLSKCSFLTKGASSRDAMLGKISETVKELLVEAKRSRRGTVQGVGFGVPGPVDVERGFVYFFPNIPGWKNTPLRKLLEKKLRVPVFVDNDASAMAVGEFLFGAGRGSRNMIALTLGTGVGGGVVLGGKLFHGHAFSATEVGHITINENGPLCGCGNRGCLEVYVGNGYLVKEVKKRLDRGEKSVLKQWISQGQTLTPELVARAAQQKDAFSKKIWCETGEHLASGLAGLLNVLNPERVVIGGGVAGAGELLFKPLRDALGRKAFPIAAQSVKISPAKLGTDAGLIGAAALVFNSQK